MDIFNGLLQGFSVALAGINILFCFLGALIGTAIGVLPGLGPAATIALLLPLTYAMGSPVTAIIMLAGIYYGAQYGGSTTSILLNLPGEAASVVTCIDGYQMARKGRAGVALGVAAIGSFIAGTAAVVGLTFFAPPLAKFALDFGPPEFFGLTSLGLLLAVTLSSGSITKGLMVLILGLLLSMVGFDPVSGKSRFTFGTIGLKGGLDFVCLAVGVFGLGEIFYNLESSLKTEIVTTKIGKVFPTLKDWADSKWAIYRGSAIGFFVGIIPGGGAVIASLASYAVEKKISKHPEEFGEGAIEGVAGPESANNSASSSSFIPLLTLGIPGNAAIAMIFAALMIHGITPGPFLVKEHPEVFWGVIASMYIGNVMLLVLNLPLVGLWVQMLRIPYGILAPIIVLFTTIGVYSTQNQVFDIYSMLFFAVLGYLMRKLNFDPVPLPLAFVLGPLVERSLRQSLLLSGGDLTIFVSRPISGTLITVFVLLILGQTAFYVRKKMYKSPSVSTRQ